MEPKTFSATALDVADKCLSRYYAEHIERGRGFGGLAAGLGSAVHGALEMYVKTVHLEKKMPAELKILEDFFKMSYMDIFNTAELDTVDYFEGVEMIRAWYKRTDFSKFTVLSVEVKENFPVQTSIGPIPFNYIWDRHDQLGETEFRVVDYKTNRWGLNPEDLKKKVQARCYGLAAQIKYPNASRIWVQFDMLRHKGPVGIVFSRDDNIATWNFLKEKAEQIIATDGPKAPESLNPECTFCVKKVSCGALQRNIKVGGVMSLADDPAKLVDTRAQMEFQRKALASAIENLDEVILGQAKAADVFNFESDQYTMGFSVWSGRAIDAERAEHVLGPKISSRYMGKTLRIGDVDKLLKGDELTEEQKSQLASLIYFKQGEPKVKVDTKNPIDD